jgi:hypothetical protein
MVSPSMSTSKSCRPVGLMTVPFFISVRAMIPPVVLDVLNF